MPASLTIAQLNSTLTAEQLTRARTQSLIQPATGSDPVTEEITAACAIVDTYSAGRILPAALATALARDLAAWNIARRLGTPTEQQTTARDRAYTDLESIRDGKFPGIPLDPTAATTTGTPILHGTRTRIL